MGVDPQLRLLKYIRIPTASMHERNTTGFLCSDNPWNEIDCFKKNGMTHMSTMEKRAGQN